VPNEEGTVDLPIVVFVRNRFTESVIWESPSTVEQFIYESASKGSAANVCVHLIYSNVLLILLKVSSLNFRLGFVCSAQRTDKLCR
jgi:hypothetical protein